MSNVGDFHISRRHLQVTENVHTSSHFKLNKFLQKSTTKPNQKGKFIFLKICVTLQVFVPSMTYFKSVILRGELLIFVITYLEPWYRHFSTHSRYIDICLQNRKGRNNVNALKNIL